MMLRHKKLREWAAAGLLTEEQAESIQDYERSHKAGRFGRGLTGLGIFAILVGIVSIIAANWNAIPPLVKIGTHASLNLLLGGIAVWAERRGHDLWREGASLAFLGLTFTLIILVGQVYQLDGSFGGALSLWILITLPFFLLLGKTYMTSAPWMAAFLLTGLMVMVENLEFLPSSYQIAFAVGVGALFPLALMADGMVDRFRRCRPALCASALKSGMALSVLLATFSLILVHPSWLGWRYASYDVFLMLDILGAGLIAICLHAFFYGLYKGRDDLRYGAYFAGAGLVAFMLPFLDVLPNIKGVGVLPFIIYWVFLGWLGQVTGHMRLLSLAITVIAVRIFAVYVEIFGTLMDTGIGLICGGLVVLVLISLARRLNTRLTKKVTYNATL